MKHLGYIVYFWGERQQDRLLVEGIAPVVANLRRQGLLSRFFFDRMDMRGPHLHCLLSVPASDDIVSEAGRIFSKGLDEYLALAPSLEDLPREILEKRHAECRGKELCSIDGLEGFGDNNTYMTFEGSSTGYPFWLTRNVASEEEIWESLDGLTDWGLRQLARSPGKMPLAVAIKWLASMDRYLPAAEADPFEYWAYHASCLILTLEERLKTERRATLAALPGAIGHKNNEVFGRLFAESMASEWGESRKLCELVKSMPVSQRFAFLRGIIHVSLKQLGIPVSLHIPLVLFAWNRYVDGESSSVQ